MFKNKLTIIIPCKNEEENILNTLDAITNKLINIKFEFIVINDFSTDKTFKIVDELSKKDNKVKIFNNISPGLGNAIGLGIKKSSSEFIAIMMADLSDDPEDLVNYFNLINNGKLDAVFGSRFIKNSFVKDYPKKKLILNRIFNIFVKIITYSDYNDFTNAFKIYRKETLMKLQPFVSDNFNIFLEMPLKLILNNYKYKIIPINWSNRKFGKAKFKINELGSKYIYTLYHVIKQTIFKKLN